MNYELVVTTAADVVDANDGVISLREAIAAAEAGVTAEDGSYTITFDPSLKGKTISWGSRYIVGDNIFTNFGNPLVVNGDIDGDGTADITLQGNGSERFFNTSGGNYINFNGLTFTGGYDLNGGAIDTGAYLTISNCVFSDNEAGNGGGAIVVSNGLLTVVNSIFEGNYAWYGGAVFTAWDGKAEILDSTFTNNSTLYESCGGAIQNGWWCYSNANSVSVVN